LNELEEGHVKKNWWKIWGDFWCSELQAVASHSFWKKGSGYTVGRKYFAVFLS